ncbi:phospho-sugar mutase [Cyclobacteriaceae bacterium]|jgi:phosphoglucomutase|nr:phospho-sugar mutase [Cyclobacteriaceae bacterium]
MNFKEKAQSWLNSSKLSDAARQQIELLKKDPVAFEDAFYKDLAFGTGGLRGLMGIGSNRINEYTVAMATQGFANYLKEAFPNQQIKVAIAHDSRNNTELFTRITAEVFSANEILVYLFKELRPTPTLSFAIRTLQCHGGVVLTASHNPKEYNGYKAYWNDGAQLIAPHDDHVINNVKLIKSIDEVNFDKKSNLIKYLDDTVDHQYLDMIASLSLSSPQKNKASELKIVFSPIHGTGITLVPSALEKFGFENVTVVSEQAQPDGNFPTVIYPNPEEAEALEIALKTAKNIDADLVLATDPDADRVGIAAKNANHEFELLNGNQTAALLIYYLLTQWKEKGQLKGQEYIVKTIVTTELISAIAAHFKVTCLDTLTGFKYIAEKIRQLESTQTFIGGGEESYGYLIGDKVRDKDAVMSCAMIAELTAWAKEQNKTLFDLLLDIWIKFGLYHEGLISITKKGKAGALEIQEIMNKLRNNPPIFLNDFLVTEIIDYSNLTHLETKTKKILPLDSHKSNVLQFITEDGSRVSIRPSGTEPKIKIYFSVHSSLQRKSELKEKKDQLDTQISKLSKSLLKHF